MSPKDFAITGAEEENQSQNDTGEQSNTTNIPTINTDEQNQGKESSTDEYISDNIDVSNFDETQQPATTNADDKSISTDTTSYEGLSEQIDQQNQQEGMNDYGIQTDEPTPIDEPSELQTDEDYLQIDQQNQINEINEHQPAQQFPGEDLTGEQNTPDAKELEKAQQKQKSMDMLTNMAKTGINKNETINSNEIDLEIFTQSLDEQKRKKQYVKITILIVGLLLFGGLSYFIYAKKDLLANILSFTDQTQKEQPINPVQTGNDTKNNDQSKPPKQQNPDIQEIDKKRFAQLGMENFYDTYYSVDFELIKNGNMNPEQKERFLIKINLLIKKLKQKEINYLQFRKQYNEIINNAFEQINLPDDIDMFEAEEVLDAEQLSGNQLSGDQLNPIIPNNGTGTNFTGDTQQNLTGNQSSEGETINFEEINENPELFEQNDIQNTGINQDTQTGNNDQLPDSDLTGEIPVNEELPDEELFNEIFDFEEDFGDIQDHPETAEPETTNPPSTPPTPSTPQEPTVVPSTPDDNTTTGDNSKDIKKNPNSKVKTVKPPENF